MNLYLKIPLSVSEHKLDISESYFQMNVWPENISAPKTSIWNYQNQFETISVLAECLNSSIQWRSLTLKNCDTLLTLIRFIFNKLSLFPTTKKKDTFSSSFSRSIKEYIVYCNHFLFFFPELTGRNCKWLYYSEGKRLSNEQQSFDFYYVILF